MLERQAARQVATEDGPEPPEHRRAEREDDRLEPRRVDVERLRERDQPDAEQCRDEEPDETPSRLLAEDHACRRDHDQRLHLLQDDRSDRIPFTNACVKRIVAMADAPAPIAIPAST